MAKKTKQSLPLCVLDATRPPTPTDDSAAGFLTGSIWIHNGAVYTCLNTSASSAIWLNEASLKQDRINGIATGLEITVETFAGAGTNKRIRVGNGTWYITPSEYTKATDTVSDEITLCVTGGDFKYYDVVADTSGAITIHEGTPSTAPSHYVIDPLTEVLLGFITVGDAVIEELVIPTTVLETFFESIYVSSGVATLDCQGKAFPRFLINTLGSSPLELVIDNTFGVVEISIVIDIPPNSDKGLITLPVFCYPTTYQINDNARYYSVKMTKYLGLLFCDFQPLSETSLKQNINQVKSASFVAQNDNNYVTNATVTVTDPSPVNGKGYTVTVIAGTTTIDSVAYSSAGTKITRIYNGTSWITNTGSGGTITDLSGIPTSTATANTLAFFDADKELASAPSLSSLGIADITYVDTQDKKFKLVIEFQSAAFIYTYYFEAAATLTLVRKESTISVVEYSTNGGGSYTTIPSMGIISLAMPSATYVIFRITYVTPSLESRGNLYFEGTY